MSDQGGLRRWLMVHNSPPLCGVGPSPRPARERGELESKMCVRRFWATSAIHPAGLSPLSRTRHCLFGGGWFRIAGCHHPPRGQRPRAVKDLWTSPRREEEKARGAGPKLVWEVTYGPANRVCGPEEPFGGPVRITWSSWSERHRTGLPENRGIKLASAQRINAAIRQCWREQKREQERVGMNASESNRKGQRKIERKQ